MVFNPVKDESRKSDSLTKFSDKLVNSEEKIHPLIQNSSLRLVEWLVSGKSYLQKEYQKGLYLNQIANQAGESGRWVSWFHSKCPIATI